MKACTLITALLLTVPVTAQQTAQQPEQPVARQLTGHVLSAETHRSHHSTSVYNPSTGQTSSGGGNSIERDTEIQVGNLVYESSQIHKEVQVAKDYPVTIETDKHGVAKKLALIVGEKKYLPSNLIQWVAGSIPT
jgi:negative regulator of sigma E activity